MELAYAVAASRQHSGGQPQSTTLGGSAKMNPTEEIQ